ncbi:MAG: hypothetical protein AB1695_12690 [Stygiobacter sp.]
MLGLTQEQWLVIVTALLAVSEALSLIPAVKSNGIFQLIVNLLKKLAGK